MTSLLTRPAHRRPPVGRALEELLGADLPIRIEAYDGSHLGPADAPATIVIRSPDALRRVLTAPGELGLARAYVSGDLEVEGDLTAVLGLRDVVGRIRPGPHLLLAGAQLVRTIGPTALRPLAPPPEEAHPHGRRHTRGRDAEAIAHHYDVGNEFYEILLGPSMTYSCAVWDDTAVGAPDGLERAQGAKYELICRKLGLRPGQRLLDVGCGWGGMARHAARHHGVEVVGITVSQEQAVWARERTVAEGLDHRVEIRFQDYRDIADGPFDAISSIGMFEHVGRRQLETYVRTLFGLLRPGGRLLNHAIGRPGYPQPATPAGRLRALNRRVATAVGASWPSRIDSALMDRYVFPDGELHEVGTLVSMLQEAGFEVRHLESLREHYALTLRAWVANLEQAWDEAVREVGEGRARVWRLYMAACALGFEHGSTQVHQVLAVAPDDGRSGMPLRPCF